MKEFGTVWCANIVIAAFATSLIPLPTAMAGNAMPSKLKDNIAHRTLAGDVLACERCGVTNVSGSIPDRKPIEPAMVSATRATDRPDFQSTTAIISSAAGTNVSSLTTTNWKQLPPLPRTAVTPLARNNTAAAYDEAHGVVVVFGGRHYQLVNGNWVPGDLGDTWIWNGQEWSEQHPINKPPPRSFTTMAYDPAVGKIVLFGGWCFSCGTYLNDTWEWDGNNWTQINTPTAPPPRIGASIGYDAAHNQFVLFGGQVVIGGVSRRVADTWIFDGVTWTQVFPSSSPTARSGDANLMTYVPANDSLILFGGTTGGGNTFNDTWLWNGTTWVQLNPANSPPVSFSPALVYDAASSQAVLFRFEGDTWTWDGQNWQQSSAVSPQPRFGSVYAYDAAVGKVLLYSGTDCLPQFDDEYLWDGTAWTQVDLGDRFPPQRTYSQMAFDSARDKTVLFGGVRDGCSFLADTWIWNGMSWNWLHPPASPPARGWASLAFDPQRKVTVLFGGRGSDSADRNDTWTFDGANWIAQSPLTSPPLREGAAMTFDSVSGKIVLFGGASIIQAAGSTTTTILNDTWTWDGANWVQEQPIAAPPGRFYSNMTHDNQGRPTLFGGAVSSGAIYADTWRWDGANHTWVPVPAAGPLPRYAAGMAFDGASQNIILFSGRGASGFQADMWAFDGTVWQQLSPTVLPSARAYPATSDGSLTNPPTFMGGGAYVGPENAEAWVWGTPFILKITSISRLANDHLIVTGETLPGAAINIQASSDLNMQYSMIGSVTADPSGAFQYEDASASTAGTRFYRASYP